MGGHRQTVGVSQETAVHSCAHTRTHTARNATGTMPSPGEGRGPRAAVGRALGAGIQGRTAQAPEGPSAPFSCRILPSW